MAAEGMKPRWAETDQDGPSRAKKGRHRIKYCCWLREVLESVNAYEQIRRFLCRTHKSAAVFNTGGTGIFASLEYLRLPSIDPDYTRGPVANHLDGFITVPAPEVD